MQMNWRKRCNRNTKRLMLMIIDLFLAVIDDAHTVTQKYMCDEENET